MLKDVLKCRETVKKFERNVFEKVVKSIKLNEIGEVEFGAKYKDYPIQAIFNFTINVRREDLQVTLIFLKRNANTGYLDKITVEGYGDIPLLSNVSTTIKFE